MVLKPSLSRFKKAKGSLCSTASRAGAMWRCQSNAYRFAFHKSCGFLASALNGNATLRPVRADS